MHILIVCVQSLRVYSAAFAGTYHRANKSTDLRAQSSPRQRLTWSRQITSTRIALEMNRATNNAGLENSGAGKTTGPDEKLGARLRLFARSCGFFSAALIGPSFSFILIYGPALFTAPLTHKRTCRRCRGCAGTATQSRFLPCKT